MFGILPLALQLVTPAYPQTPSTAPLPNLRVTNAVRVYELDKDAVVNIASTRIVNARVGIGNEFFDPIFSSPMVRAVPMQSLGSGFIIHSAGYIVTNEHVIDRASEVHVVLADGQKLPAQVLATDNEHDLAVLKVTPAKDKPLPSIPLGSSDDLLVGEPVYAIGNPLGYAGSLTQGIVSATNRELDFGETSPGVHKIYRDLIQTDASINPGNSGGPLINAYGQVIGINSAIRSDAHGIGFAISVSRLRDLLPAFLNTVALNRAEIGFTLEEARTTTPPSTVAAAVFIKKLAAASGAAKAGLVNGDQLIMVNNAPVVTIVDALVALANAKPGDTIPLRVARAGKQHDLKIPVTAAPPPESEIILAKRLGLSAETITPALVKSLHLAVDAGVYVSKVEKGSSAAEAGLERGDILFQLGPYYINSVDDMATLVKSADENLRARLGVIRGNTRARTIIQIH